MDLPAGKVNLTKVCVTQRLREDATPLNDVRLTNHVLGNKSFSIFKDRNGLPRTVVCKNRWHGRECKTCTWHFVGVQ